MNLKKQTNKKKPGGEGGGCWSFLTVAGVSVAQGLLRVEPHADVPAVGRRGAGAGARALVVAAAAAHRALRPRRPAGPGAFHCDAHKQKKQQ